jgi:hypothetical protein
VESLSPLNPEPLQAVQHIRRMRGGSQAHLLRASNNHFYVTKFRNNPQHVRILANEYLGSKLGVFLGLPMPEVRIIDVPGWLIENSPELKIDHGAWSAPVRGGLQFGSRYVADPHEAQVFDYLPEAMLKRVSNRQDFARVLVFDKWTGNSDGRQVVFAKPSGKRSYRAAFIDQGHCFNAGEWNFSESPLRGVYAPNAVYEDVTGWKSFEPVLSQMEQMDRDELGKIAAEVPEEWYQYDSQGIIRLIETLYARRSVVRELITSFRKSNRTPFPNWTGD